MPFLWGEFTFHHSCDWTYHYISQVYYMLQLHSYVLYIHSYKIYFQSEILTGIIKDTAHMASALQGAKCVFELEFASNN